MARTLRLNREALTELATSDLESVAGGGYPPEPTPPFWAPTKYCPTNYCVPITYYCPPTN